MRLEATAKPASSFKFQGHRDLSTFPPRGYCLLRLRKPSKSQRNEESGCSSHHCTPRASVWFPCLTKAHAPPFSQRNPSGWHQERTRGVTADENIPTGGAMPATKKASESMALEVPQKRSKAPRAPKSGRLFGRANCFKGNPNGHSSRSPGGCLSHDGSRSTVAALA